MLQRRVTAGRTSRSLVPSEGGAARSYAVPILGRVAAGQPLLEAENREGELHIAPASLPGRGEDVFALRVRGDSMIEAHICDGDLVLVRRQDSAQPNEIVVAMVESDSGEAEATVKRFHEQSDLLDFIARLEGALFTPINIGDFATVTGASVTTSLSACLE